ncbi:MAG: acetyl-CoA synthetase [Frankiales bacterium]|jgi:cytochrome c551/c552|nr:acetyl-CoA synthetase [Frankiales bacterium]
MNISGRRISTTEVEHALVSHPKVAEAAVVGATDATTGQAIVAFVTVKGDIAAAIGDDATAGEALIQELRNHVATQIGPIAKPRQILLSPELPKTRSGKIMRRLLRDVAEHRDLGDVTLLDPTVFNAISERMAVAAESTPTSLGLLKRRRASPFDRLASLANVKLPEEQRRARSIAPLSRSDIKPEHAADPVNAVGNAAVVHV